MRRDKIPRLWKFSHSAKSHNYALWNFRQILSMYFSVMFVMFYLYNMKIFKWYEKIFYLIMVT